MNKHLFILGFTFIMSFTLFANTHTFRVDGPANCRAKPDGKLLFSIPDLEEITIEGASLGWVKIFYQNKECWLHGQNLRIPRELSPDGKASIVCPETLVRLTGGNRPFDFDHISILSAAGKEMLGHEIQCNYRISPDSKKTVSITKVLPFYYECKSEGKLSEGKNKVSCGVSSLYGKEVPESKEVQEVVKVPDITPIPLHQEFVPYTPKILTKKVGPVPVTKNAKGMTWGVGRSVSGFVNVACKIGATIEGTNTNECNAYNGDTSCKSVLPLLCIHKSGLQMPAGLPIDGYNGWAAGEIKLVDNILGEELTSLDTANMICQKEIGSGWRMAEFHDSWGWGFWAKGNIDSTLRFWVYINDQRSNCWNSGSKDPFI